MTKLLNLLKRGIPFLLLSLLLAGALCAAYSSIDFKTCCDDACRAQRHNIQLDTELAVERAFMEECVRQIALQQYELNELLAEPMCVLNFEEMRSGAAGGMIHTHKAGRWKGAWEIIWVRNGSKDPKGRPLNFCTGQGWPKVPE